MDPLLAVHAAVFCITRAAEGRAFLDLKASLDSLPQFAQASAEEVPLIWDLIWPVRTQYLATLSDSSIVLLFSRLHENLVEWRTCREANVGFYRLRGVVDLATRSQAV